VCEIVVGKLVGYHESGGENVLIGVTKAVAAQCCETTVFGRTT